MSRRSAGSSREARSICVVRRADSRAPETLRLVERLWGELGSLYPEMKGPPTAPDEIVGQRASFVVAWVKGKPVGCGAFRPLSEDEDNVAEIKRMYVEPTMRGRGISRSILIGLEKLARDCGYTVIRLELPATTESNHLGVIATIRSRFVSRNPSRVCWNISTVSNGLSFTSAARRGRGRGRGSGRDREL